VSSTGALISLLAQSSLNKREIDLDLAKRVLRNFVKTSSKEITIDTIQKMVCEFFDVPYDKLLQKTRKREIGAGAAESRCTLRKLLPRIH
jgi:chromosomal replication initiator protein